MKPRSFEVNKRNPKLSLPPTSPWIALSCLIDTLTQASNARKINKFEGWAQDTGNPGGGFRERYKGSEGNVGSFAPNINFNILCL